MDIKDFRIAELKKENENLRNHHLKVCKHYLMEKDNFAEITKLKKENEALKRELDRVGGMREAAEKRNIEWASLTRELKGENEALRATIDRTYKIDLTNPIVYHQLVMLESQLGELKNKLAAIKLIAD